MASNTATAVSAALIGAACGLLGGLALGRRGNEPARSGIESAAPRQQAAPFEASAIESRLDEHQRALAEVKALVAGLASPGDRTPIVADSSASTSSEPAATNPDPDRLKAIEVELAAIRQTIKEQVWVQSPPTIEQIRRAQQSPIWSEVDGLCRLASQDASAAKETILGLSYEEVLTRFGRPTDIQPAKWWYSAPGHSGFNLNFVNGYVGGISILQ